MAAALLQQGRAGGPAHEVAMKDVAFVPARITVRVGDTVEWVNADMVAHTATSKQDGFDVNVPPSDRGSAVMTRAGTFGYICRYHPNMQGQIKVEP